MTEALFPQKSIQPWPQQHTLADDVRFKGIGIHSGKMMDVVIHPAPINTGIVFIRKDLPHEPSFPASWQYAKQSPLCTTLGQSDETIYTIEHLMAAFCGFGIDNAFIEVNGPEIPIFDGSANPFLFLFECVGRAEQQAFRRFIKVLKDIEVSDEKGARAALRPSNTLHLSSEIVFDHEVIGTQKHHFPFSYSMFKQDIAPARTFGFLKDAEKLRAAGLSLGASLDNVVVIGNDDKVMNPEGLRFKDEFVRHKVLDSLGDLYLGGWLLAGFEGYKSSHALHLKLLDQLFKDASAYVILDRPGSL